MAMDVAPSASPHADSASLKAANLSTWEAAVHHRWVDDLISGEIEPRIMSFYLIQDHRFLHSFLGLLGAAIASTDSPEARLRYAQFAGLISSDENTYFLRALEALGVTEEQRRSTPDTAPTTGFIQIMDRAAHSQNYPAIVAVLTVTEWLYQDWAARAPQEHSSDSWFVHTEWVDLHRNPAFDAFVSFLCSELDRVGPQDPDAAADYFRATVDLELDFFNAVYDDAPKGH